MTKSLSIHQRKSQENTIPTILKNPMMMSCINEKIFNSQLYKSHSLIASSTQVTSRQIQTTHSNVTNKQISKAKSEYLTYPITGSKSKQSQPLVDILNMKYMLIKISQIAYHLSETNYWNLNLPVKARAGTKPIEVIKETIT